MDIKDSPVLQAIDESMLTAIVRQSLGRDTFQIQDWRVSQLGGGAGNPVSVGLYRFEGTGRDHDEQLHWSVILKIIQSPANVGWVNFGEGDDQTHWNYWKRELFVYQSGLLEAVPEGMEAPRCFGIIERPGNVVWLWLEDIRDSSGGAWSLERYALAARHLGRFNGSYCASRPLPTYPWIGNNLTKQWLSQLQSQWQSLPWDHPHVLARYPKGNALRRMLEEGEHFQAKLDLLPRILCHGDTYPTNFMSRHGADGLERTVALDWALVNIGALGDDLGQFIFGAHTNLKTVSAEEITHMLIDSYTQGLEDSGCYFDRQLVHFGFAASGAYRVGLFQIYLLGEELKRESVHARTGVEQALRPDCFEVTMANEAFRLLDSI